MKIMPTFMTRDAARQGGLRADDGAHEIGLRYVSRAGIGEKMLVS